MKPYEIGRVVRRAIDNARQSDLSFQQQNAMAGRAVIQLEPDMTEEQAMVAVRRVREMDQEKSRVPH